MANRNNNTYRLQYLEQNTKQQPPTQKPTPKQPHKPHGCVRLFLFFVQLGLIGLLLAVIASVGGYVYLSKQLDSAINQVTAYRGTGVGGTPRFFDRNGNLLFELHTTEKRRWLAYSEIPSIVINATVSVEDDTFWTNPGFDPAAIGAAVVSNFRHDDSRPVGASTITQQLVRHIAFSYEERVGVNYWRKIREIFLSYIMTQRRSKESIIQMYLNEIYYGNLAYGIEAASQTYFGKSTTDLNLAEAAFLAGIPQSPIDWDPYTNFEAVKERQEIILDLMVTEGYISYIDAEVAKGITIELQPRIPVEEEVTNTTLEAPHFVLYVQDLLEKKYGPDALVKGGWQITTSLDLNIQNMAQQVLRDQIAAKQVEHDVSNGSIVVLKPSTGEILAMVGSANYFDDSIDGQVNVALSPRQPGSSIKPITYAAALERGWSTADVLWDVPIELDLGGGETMTPVNYDGRYHGPILLRDALANSYNIPPIQLIRDIGVPTMISTARNMGIDSLREPPGYYGLAITLGGGEVPLIEMANAYATLANQGNRPKLLSILRITDSRGNTIYDSQEENVIPDHALDPRVAYIITDILDDDNARIPAMGRNNSLDLPFPAAAKTGTTNDYRDNWVMGYTPGVVVGVWMGNSDGHPMQDSSGLQTAAPVWRQVMEGIYADPNMQNSLMTNGALPPVEFPRPDGIEVRDVCLPQGTGWGSCGATRPDLFIAGAALHGIGRVGYNINPDINPGAWTLSVLPLSGADAQRITFQTLPDGSTPPTPSICVVNSSRPPAGATTRLFLPFPPYYPDEVKARWWALQNGYNIAPATVCPLSAIPTRAANSNTNSNSNNNTANQGFNTGNGAPAPETVVLEYNIMAPSVGQHIQGNVPILGTVLFDPDKVQYYQLEIGAGDAPTEWTIIGTTHNQAVRSGLIEQLATDTLTPGIYTLRLSVIGYDGYWVEEPFTVLVTVGE